MKYPLPVEGLILLLGLCPLELTCSGQSQLCWGLVWQPNAGKWNVEIGGQEEGRLSLLGVLALLV